MVMLAAALSSMNPRAGMRVPADGGGGIAVRPPSTPAPVMRPPSLGTGSPVNPIVAIGARPVSPALPVRAPFTSAPPPVKGTALPSPTVGTGGVYQPAPPGIKGTVLAPITSGPPQTRSPISTLVPTLGPQNGGGIVNSQPPVNTPPSGSPPSMSLSNMSDDTSITGGAGDLATIAPVQGFSLTTGWIVLIAIAGLMIWAAKD